MKKKLMSLLLVIAIMMSSVSMGLGAFAAPAGKGIEAINAFELTGKEVTGTDSNTEFTIRSKVPGYQIKVNSVNASIRYSADETGVSTTGSVTLLSNVANVVCGEGGKTFQANVKISSGLAGLIRYECNYDLLDSSGNVVYEGMTGYGYGIVSANGRQTGELGSPIGEPDKHDSYGFDGFDSANTLYVQVPTANLYAKCETSGNHGSDRKSTSVTGNPPSTLTIYDFEWDNNCGGSTVQTVLWFELKTPPSGYYDFNITFYDGDSHDVEMYYRDDADMDKALKLFKQYLAEGREKSYYTADSWNTYLQMLELTALVGMAIPGPNYAFGRACVLADDAAGGTYLVDAKNGLVEVAADYTDVDKAYNTDFAGKKNEKISVTTYTAGSTTSGTTDVNRYRADSISAVDVYYGSINRTLKKSDQKTVDGYEATIRNMTANLAYADAVYTYLDIAINEYNSRTDSDIYTTNSWNSYKTVVDNAKAISRSLKTDSQSGINSALTTIIRAKNELDKLPADFTELDIQINRADEIWAEYNSTPTKMLTGVDGFADLWDNYFVPYYNDATSDDMEDSKIDEQEKVDNAAFLLRETVNALARYRLLDTTELYNAILLTPEKGQEFYEADSYNTWNELRTEGRMFYAKAMATYQGDDRKTYENYEEMVRLIAVIINAFESIEKIKADFTALNEAVAKIPSDDVLALYEEGCVTDIKKIVAGIDYGATFDEQDKVDEITENLKAALAKLTPEHYKSANYDDVDAAIAEAEALDKYVYTNYSIVETAINAVDRTKKIVDQDKVDAMAAAIREAIKNLEYIPADYTDVYKAIEEAEAVENKHWYANYDKVLEAIDAVDWTKNRSQEQQAEVDAMAAAIREAIKNLKDADADYSGVRDAIAEYNAKAPLTDFYPDTVDAVDQAISKVQYALKAKDQEQVNAWEAEIREAIKNMKLRPADYSRLNAAIAYAQSFNPDEYSNYEIVTDAINAVDWNLDCRQNTEMNEQIAAINDAVAQLKLLPADYSKVDEAIVAARYAYSNGDYPYTPESIQVIEDVIASINRDYDIKHQADVDAYIVKIQIAVAQLTYIRADYTELDKVKAKYDNLQRDLYASLSAVDAYVAKIDWDKTIDKQSEVDTYVAELDAMLGSLEYAPADYTAVDNAITIYNAINKEYYEDFDIAAVEMIINQVERDLKKNEQERVNKMADDINAAVAELRTKMKKANLDALLDAVDAAKAKIAEMVATGYEVDLDTYLPLDTFLGRANDYNADTTIDNQKDIDTLTANIIEATANLEFVFTIILDGSGLVIEGGYIYGFEEGTTVADAKELIKFVGAAEIKIIETKNGFGTDAKIQFISTKDGSVIATYTVLVFGDANGDAVIDMFDVAYIVELVNEGGEPEEKLLRVLDITKEGYLDTMDVTIMIGLANMDATLAQDGSMKTY